MVKIMISRQKIFLIIIAVLFLISLKINLSRMIPESKNYENYIEALQKYEEKDYSLAYNWFGKISRFSKIKPAALYRQALCANELNDSKSEIKKYKQIVKYYPNYLLTVRVKYLKAQKYFELNNFKKAQKEFKRILNKYPSTDYAIASEYYLGLIELNEAKNITNPKKKAKVENKAVKYFKNYIKQSPTGKYAMNSLQNWLAFDSKLNPEDNLLVGKIYQANQNYTSALEYLKKTNISVSWPYLVKNYFETNNLYNVRFYTEIGLKGENSKDVLINENIDEKEEKESIYKAIDMYLKVSERPRDAISYLISIAKIKNGQDYLLYKRCNNLSSKSQPACYNTLYYKYPNGDFAAESLANIFYDKVKKGNYAEAKRLGKIHLAQFKDVKSSPKVTFWLAKISERMQKQEDARVYYKKILRNFPDDYYAYHSFLNLNRLKYFSINKLRQKPIEFPYKKSNFGLIEELLKVEDYDLIKQIYKDDRFIQSWLFYHKGDFSTSARIARDAMDEMEQKPHRSDLRWRLVYPIHYHDEIEQNAAKWGNDPTLILAIIREESYFNPGAKSPAGASGLMQLMPATAKEMASRTGLSLDDLSLLFEPGINIKLGNVYYSVLKKTLSNKDILAVLAYNGGMGSVSRWKQNLDYYDVDDFIEQIPYPETKNYLNKVYRSYWNYLRIYDGIRF